MALPASTPGYQPVQSSLRRHPLPAWFDQARLGLLVHWGPYSVPAWAPASGEMGVVIREQGWSAWFAANPYAEWYLNSMQIPGSPTERYHHETYGEDFPYGRAAGGAGLHPADCSRDSVGAQGSAPFGPLTWRWGGSGAGDSPSMDRD
jgi:hypothetical protein